MQRVVRAAMLGLILASMLLAGFAYAAPSTSVPLASLLSQLGPGHSGPNKPGKGCGDKNHYHEDEDECKDKKEKNDTADKKQKDDNKGKKNG